jgi:hypothetical protein
MGSAGHIFCTLLGLAVTRCRTSKCEYSHTLDKETNPVRVIMIVGMTNARFHALRPGKYIV